MEVNVLPGAGVGHVVLLVGGGARVTIPPGNGFTIIVNPVAGGAVGAAGGAMGAAVANENIAAITADIVQHSVNNTLSTTQILHMLRVDNTFEVHQVFVPEPPFTQWGFQEVQTTTTTLTPLATTDTIGTTI
ncbi:hypothetical protein F2Q69_00017009 [Brassica cretica]|uniref:Uncharacterized protein n=1 Tax=Brassica cretica TaxID=69181 RepID=A0A8S9R6R9_BRACR|nr:hypothetical protein F2Q69_00017009 [Brassica cretica]